MPLPFRSLAIAALALGTVLTVPAGAQDISDPQPVVDRVVFAVREGIEQRKAAEQQRVEALDQRAQRQAVQIEQQAQSVQQLAGELLTLREERQLVELAQGFEAALVAGRWPQARSFLADSVVVDLPGGAAPAPVVSAAGVTGTEAPAGQPVAATGAVPADSFVAQLAAEPRRTILPRSNQRVRFDGDRAVLESDGFSWGQAGRGRVPAVQSFGRYEYRFERTAQGWKIGGISFQPQPAS